MTLPKTRDEWGKAVKREGLEHNSIHDTGEEYSSGSGIRLKQFLLLRVILPALQSASQLPTSKNVPLHTKHYTDATNSLNSLEDWNYYIHQAPLSKLGTFSLVEYYHRQTQATTLNHTFSLPKIENSPVASRTRSSVLASSSSDRPVTPTPAYRGAPQTPSPGTFTKRFRERLRLSSDEGDTDDLLENTISPFSPAISLSANQYEAIEDEQIVNTALILLLNAVTLHKDTGSDWTLHRRRFILAGADTNVYEARVDGILKCVRGRVGAIVEVKPYLRINKLDAIRMQEAAQMAAWISSYPPEGEQQPYR